MSRAQHTDVEPPATEPEIESPGKVVVDARGHSVWQWAKDVLENTSVLLKRLENKDLALESTQKVPIVPGSGDVLETEQDAMRAAQEIGYPVIIKATAGGGGKGMRVVHSDTDLLANVKMAQAEAAAAFGNPGVYMEKYITDPRHVEIQVMADQYGNVLHLGERDDYGRADAWLDRR